MFDHIRWLFSLLHPYKAWIFLGASLAGLTTLANIGLLATSAVLLSQAALMPPLLWLMPWITGVRFFGISRAVLRYSERLLNHSIAYRILGGLRVRIYEHLEKIVPDRLLGYSEGMLYRRLIAGIDVLQYFYLRAVSLPWAFVMVLLASSFLLFFFSKPAAVVLALGMLTAGIFIPFFSRRASKDLRRQDAELSDRLAEQLLDLRLGLTDLSTHPEARHALEYRIREQSRRLSELRFRSARIAKWAEAGMDAIGHLTMILALIVSMPAVTAGEMSGVYLAMVGMVCLGAFEAVQAMPTAIVQMGDSLEAAKSLKAVEDIPAPPTPDQIRHPEHFDLQLKNLGFHYHQNNASFIQGIDILIPEGRHVVITGHSGSGKSSLAKIMAGLWTTDAGQISLGGVSYDSLSRESLSSHIAYLEQDPTIFHASLRENLLLANPKASEEALWSALEEVGLKDLAMSLPEGLSSSLGESGDRLSGGQRQRLAAARLFLQDPKIVILDEPGQNLDRQHADALLKSIRTWAHDKSLVLISHRLEDLRGANFIYVMSRGGIAEQGSYQELLAQPFGHLRALVDLAEGRS